MTPRSASGLTPARLEVLSRCLEGEGLNPSGTDWFAIYWLVENGYAVETFHRTVRRFYPTERGVGALNRARRMREAREAKNR